MMVIKFACVLVGASLALKNPGLSFAADSAQFINEESTFFSIPYGVAQEELGETLSPVVSASQEIVSAIPPHTIDEISVPELELVEKKHIAMAFLESLACLEQPNQELKYSNYFDEYCVSNIDSNGFAWCYVYKGHDGLQKLSFMKNCAQLHFDSFWNGLLTLNWLVGLQLSFTLNSYVPHSIDHFSQLTSLDLSSNQLTDLPDSIRNLKKLTYLTLSYNKFEVFPDVIADLLDLESLDLYENKIKTIPSIIKKLKNIRSFDLRKNPLLLSNSENIQSNPLYANPLLYSGVSYLGSREPSAIDSLEEWGFSELRKYFGSSRVFHLSL